MAGLQVTEIFYSIQGESSRAGQPCAFVRLTGCPMRCVWCDTAYAFEGGAFSASTRSWARCDATRVASSRSRVENRSRNGTPRT